MPAPPFPESRSYLAAKSFELGPPEMMMTAQNTTQHTAGQREGELGPPEMMMTAGAGGKHSRWVAGWPAASPILLLHALL